MYFASIDLGENTPSPPLRIPFRRLVPETKKDLLRDTVPHSRIWIVKLNERVIRASGTSYNHQSPLPTTFNGIGTPCETMDIKQIVNSKGSKGAAAAAAAANGAAQDMQLLHSISQANSFPMSETGSERGNSPHDSEHSRYSAPRLVNGMNGSHMRYPSPTAMQNPLPMLQQPYRPDNGFENGIMQQQENNRGTGRTPNGDGTAQKAFPCSTCGKGFARRSDLARHGMSS